MTKNTLDFLPQTEGFLHLPEELSGKPEDAKVVVIPYGLEASVTYGGGTSAGPQAMIDASSELEMFDEELWCEPYRHIGIATLKPQPIPRVQEQAIDHLESIVESVLVAGKFPMTFGGEHAITAGTIRPFARRYNNLAVLHFDAHADLRDGYLGVHYSHAAALRRVLDHKQITNLISCGIRNISAEEIPFYDEQTASGRLKIHFAKDKKKWDYDAIVAPLAGRDVYLTFDVDGLDASLMPATGTPEPGGMFWDDVMEIIRRAAKISNIVGADVNELAPVKGFHGPNFIAAKLAYKIISFSFLKDKIKI